MGRKLKYKDVVKRGPPTNNKNNKRGNKKPQKERPKYSIFKQKTNFKRKAPLSDDRANKRGKFERQESPPLQAAEEPEYSSESDLEIEDPLKQLQDTFKSKIRNDSIVSSSESASESEEDNDREMSEGKGGEGGLDKENAPITSDLDEAESDQETQLEENDLGSSRDPFVKHVCYELHPSLLESLESLPASMESLRKHYSHLGNVIFQIPKCDFATNRPANQLDDTVYALPSPLPKKIDPKLLPQSCKELFIKSQIAPNIGHANKCPIKEGALFTPLQQELFSIINDYRDLYYPERTFDNAPELRFVYCLHALNHILKTRTKVLHHNSKLSKKDDVPEEFRDQGLVRPKVLIVVPFKDSAFKVVNVLIDLMFKEDKGNVIKRNRFIEDYTGNELHLPKKNPKPEDYETTFAGNTGDDFKLGISVTKKSLKLYSDFYSSDIIVASPLGLRTIIGAEGEQDRDYDFLTSIELLVLDQADMFLMQNWDHINHLFNYMHLKPKELHGTDVSRVRQWCLNLWAKYYRQTLIFSSVTLPEINSVFNKKCFNYAGKVKVANSVALGCLSQVTVQLPHVFYKFSASSPADAIEKRFSVFLQKILPHHKDSSLKGTLIYVPSYFDFVKIRNHFKREDVGFVQVCEYSKDSKVARARDMFYHGDAMFLLYTERFHFYHRIRVKGVRHLIFYQPPSFSHFYNEISNFMQESNLNKKVGSPTNMTVTVLYSKYDILQLAAIVGTERAAKMVQSDRDVHMIVTGAD